MLVREPGLEVVGEAENGREALEMCRELRSDLVLMDVRMPQIDGMTATQAIKKECPSISVLIVTTHESPEYLMNAIRAGAGYVLKNSTKQQLLNAVWGVLGGESPLNQELAMQLLWRLIDENRQHAEPLPESVEKREEEALAEALTESLSPRELEVSRLLALGKTNRQIAKELMISLSTVKVNVQHIITKFGVSDRTQAAVRAVECGLFSNREEE